MNNFHITRVQMKPALLSFTLVLLLFGTSATAQSRNFQMALWTNESSPPIDADIGMFNQDDSQAIAPARSVLNFFLFETSINDPDPKTAWNNMVARNSYDFRRIVAVVVDEPYLNAGVGSPTWQNPCYDPTLYQETLSAYHKLQELAQAVRTTSPTTRFWINFSEPEIQWMMDPNCPQGPLTLAGPFVDVVSMDKYLAPFAGPCNIVFTVGASCVQPYYDWMVSHLTYSGQQIALVPGTFVRVNLQGQEEDNPQTQVGLLAGFFNYANSMNQVCNRPLGNTGITGDFDGCLVWLVAGFVGESFRDGNNGDLWCGEFNSPGLPCPIPNATQPIRSAWEVELSDAGFSLSASPATGAVLPGGGTSYSVEVNLVGGSGPVHLNVAGLPNGVSADFTPNPAGGSSNLQITNTNAIPGTYAVTITGANANGVSKTTTVTLIVEPPQMASRYAPVTPCRVADTRNATGPFGGPFLAGGATREFDIPNSACNIPSTALGYAVNITVVPHGPLGYLTMFPCGQNQPATSNLNSIDGRVKAVAAIVPAGTHGGACVFTANDTDLVLDVSGYFVAAGTNSSALAFYPLTPCRVADTRNANGSFGGPSLVGGATRTFPIRSSSCNIPATAQAYSLNYTSVPNGPLGYLTTWPAGQAQPLVSTLNAPTGTIVANAAIVPAGTNGDVSVFASNDSHLVIDINGYFAPPGPGGLSLFPLVPCRVLDTRNPPGSALELDPQGPQTSAPFNGTLAVQITTSGCGIPPVAAGATNAYVLNATVVPPGALGFLTLWPDGSSQPLVSTLNAIDGAVTSNMAIVSTTNGSVDAFVSNPTHLVLDIYGYFAP